MSQVRDHVRSIRDGVPIETRPALVTGPATPRVDLRENATLPNATPPAPDGLAADLAFEASLRPLTPRQLTAIGLLTMGKSVVATAKSLQVDPSTLHRWKANSPLFIAELNRRQAAMFDGMVVKLRLTMDRACDELLAIMTGPNKRERIEAMWKLLPMLRPQKLLAPTGPTEPAAVVDAQVRAGRAERGEATETEVTHADRLERVAVEDRAEAADRPDVAGHAATDPQSSCPVGARLASPAGRADEEHGRSQDDGRSASAGEASLAPTGEEAALSSRDASG